MGDVIQLCDAIPVDPILRKGDLVKIVEEELYLGELYLENLVGIVTEVLQCYAEDSDASGQAAVINVAVPDPSEESWDIVELSLDQVHRILGDDSKQLRGYEV